MELDFSSPYYVVVGQLSDNQQLCQERINPLLELLERVFSYYGQALLTVHRQQIIILVNRISRASLLSLLDKIQTKFNKMYQLQLNFGIGSLCYTEQETPQSFLHAKQVCEWIAFHQSVNEIRFFEDLDLGIVLPAIPSDQRTLYVKRILKSLTEEVHLFKKTLACFSKNNGSIKNCSEELFIHKNTLQYRLNKFHSLTGYTPRNYDDYHILKLAFLLVQT
ncbi:TPA: sugar diacid utilization regulator [Enterococcus faecium]|nr:helix-turn-helix domain-containing protein [Enterococcus faecium]MCH0112107.1 helix-turn-helix domain-containing protein [Enterococcus faecium]MCH0141134.1 helix-turn-helix domain-containing protein [Enterococcus faecium]MCH0152895.1 helix-turn-helix domain-containing protein [Enterococcus faecium]MCH0208360.1 helix-turn-helix domain-containing protein [Enterococcus faecium]